jgi:putative FmdB family regulatory protein
VKIVPNASNGRASIPNGARARSSGLAIGQNCQRADRQGGGLPASFGGVIVIAMPIYEYECTACAKVSSHVVMGSRRRSRRSRRSRMSCPACGATRLKRVMSSFAVVSSEASRLAEFDTSRPRDESFYRDSRNVGLWAKKRAKEMGADLGSKFEETVEKARSGKLVKEML